MRAQFLLCPFRCNVEMPSFIVLSCRSSPLCVNDLNEKLNAVKKNRDTEETDDLNDWHWEKVSHDFF